MPDVPDRQKCGQESLDFRGNNPGAVQYGNFINYYQFHPWKNRISLLPENLLDELKINLQYVHILDVGCNTGELTKAVYEFITNVLPPHCNGCKMLGIDIDPILIERANEKNDEASITFCTLNFMNKCDRELIIKDYFQRTGISRFGITFCFSTTMWIHLNSGDEGLKEFLKVLSELSDILVIEPQPWKCYKTAVRRMKLSNGEFPLFKNLEMRQSVEQEIEEYLLNECNLRKIFESSPTSWGRKLLIFRRIDS